MMISFLRCNILPTIYLPLLLHIHGLTCLTKIIISIPAGRFHADRIYGDWLLYYKVESEKCCSCFVLYKFIFLIVYVLQHNKIHSNKYAFQRLSLAEKSK